MKEVLISLFSGIIGVILTISYQHFLSPPQSFTFIYNGEEMVVTETAYAELIEENKMLKNELSNIQEQSNYTNQINDNSELTHIDTPQQTQYSTLLTNLDYFSKSNGVYTNSSVDSIDNYDTVYNSCISGYETTFDTAEPYIEYYLGSEYTILSGQLYVTRHARGINPKLSNWDIATISIYGDDILLYSYTGFSPKDKPLDFSIDITNIEFLKICFSNAYYSKEGLHHSLISLGNPIVTQ